ncbi:MAG: FAD:protein FMN transferase, partial [Bryobacteraceae bacterium]
VAIGGDLALGDPPPEKPGWRVEIEHLGKVMELANVCVSTSGDAVQFVEIGGARYSHILDPRTGVGLRNQKAVTVIAPEGAVADALATAISLAGEGLVDRYPGARVAR